MLKVTINGVDRSANINARSLSITNALSDEVDSCYFEFETTDIAEKPTESQEVIIADGTERIFAGHITSAPEIEQVGNLIYNVECVDYQRLLDKHLVIEKYENMNAGDIVKDLIGKYTKGFTTVSVETGLTVKYIAFNYKYVSECLKELADLTGYHWYADYSKDIHFFDEFKYNAPFPIDDNSTDFEGLEIQADISQLRNRVYFRGGTYLSDPFDEVQQGGKEVWNLGYKPHDLQVFVNGSPTSATVGTENLHSPADYDFLVNYQEKHVLPGKLVTASTDSLKFRYKYNVPVLTVQDDVESIDKMKWLETLKSPYALSFDGVDDYVEVLNSNSINITGSTLTFESWVYPSNYSPTEVYLCNKERQYEVGLIRGSPGTHTLQVAITTVNGSWIWIDSGLAVTLNAWSHVAVSYDGVNINFYVNGSLATKPNNFSGSIASTLNNLHFGTRNPGAGASKEILDDIRLWNVALTQQEIQANMNKELTGNEPGLVGYWKFNEGSGTTALDSTPNANHGTINGATYTNDTTEDLRSPSDGIHEHIIVDKEVESKDLARQRSQADLDQFSNPTISGRFRTNRKGLRSGQVIAIKQSKRNIDDKFLISRVTMRWLTVDTYSFDVEIASKLKGIEELLIDLFGRSRQIEVRDDEVLDKLLVLRDKVSFTDSLAYTTGAPITTVGSARVGYAEVGA